MIPLYSTAGKVFIWNPSDVMVLRKEHCIVGSLAGIYPSRPFQIQTKWLPLQLMKEEACLLIEKGIAKLVSSPKNITDPKLIDSYFEQRDKLCQEQTVLLKENRKKIIMEKADEIYEGKKRKYMKNTSKENKDAIKSTKEESDIEENSNKSMSVSLINETVDCKSQEVKISSDMTEITSIKEDCTEGSDIDDFKNKKKKLDFSVLADEEIDVEHSTLSQSSESEISKTNESAMDTDSKFPDKQTVIETELAKVPDVSKELCMVQLFTECPWKNVSATVKLAFPITEMEKLRYAVFKDLWEKKYYLTSGFKFGGDFLVYEGDPMKYHAVFIVVCVLRSTRMQALDILTYGRLGHQVKKTVALASLSDSGDIDYISINWESDLS